MNNLIETLWNILEAGFLAIAIFIVWGFLLLFAKSILQKFFKKEK